MRRRRFTATAIAALFGTCMVVPALAADIDYGKPGTPVKLVVGYQPYYTQAWSGVVMRGKKFYEKYLPKGSTVDFQIGLQGAIIVNNLLAGKQHIGYYGDMPGIVSTTKQDVADIRLVAVVGMGWDQCNAFLVRTDAPKFADDQEAIRRRQGMAQCRARCSAVFPRSEERNGGREDRAGADHRIFGTRAVDGGLRHLSEGRRRHSDPHHPSLRVHTRCDGAHQARVRLPVRDQEHQCADAAPRSRDARIRA